MKCNNNYINKEKISCLSLGTWVFGGESWGGSNEADCINAVRAAISNGINCIDTAPIYGNGLSESIVGKAIQGDRDKVFLATKCGLILNGKKVEYNLTKDSINKEVEQSLNRLNTDRIDLYQCHWPDKSTPIEETIEALLALKEQGKIRYIGLSNYSNEEFEKALSITEIQTSQDQYSILDRSIEEQFLPFLIKSNVGLLAYGPLAGGILTGKYNQPQKFKGFDARNFFYKYYQGKAFDKTTELLSELKTLDKPLNQIAINWVRQQAGVATVLIGARSAQQVEDNVKAIHWDLSPDEMDLINQISQEKIHG